MGSGPCARLAAISDRVSQPGPRVLSSVVGRLELEPVEDPEVSIIVLAFRRADVLRSMFESLIAHRSTHAFEVVVVSNGARPEVGHVVEDELHGATLVRSRVNLGFAGGCNLGASAARGEFLVLLNDDATVEPGWLDALVAAAGDLRRAGAIGSLVLFPDGTVQEAGGMVGPDLAVETIGRGGAAEDVRAKGRHLVDYVSGCATLLRREAWDAIGGFDERYYPAYFEDVDLCLRLRAAGWEVWLDPAAAVRHGESASSDPMLKGLAYELNHERFLAAWRRSAEAGDPEGAADPEEAGPALRTEDGDVHELSPEALRDRLRIAERDIAGYDRATELEEEHVRRLVVALDDAWRNGRETLDVLVAEQSEGHRLRAALEAAQNDAAFQASRAVQAEADLHAIQSLRSFQVAQRAERFLERHPGFARLLGAPRRLLRRRAD